MDENPYESPQHANEKAARTVVGCLLTFVLFPIALFIAFFVTCTSVTVGLIQLLPDIPIDLVAWAAGPIAGFAVVIAIIHWRAKEIARGDD
jgi:hypothetical protein